MLWRGYELGPWCLGTAQLGLPYGIANKHGQPDEQGALRIVQAAVDAGIVSFDTATAYGDSHNVLARNLYAAGAIDKALIVTKLSDAELHSADVVSLVSGALCQIDVPSFFAVLAHSVGSLNAAQRLSSAFRSLKDAGLVQFCGVSVYSEDEARIALDVPEADVVQMPLNVLDRGGTRVMEKARAANKLLMFRSALLQGLLAMNELPPAMTFAEDLLADWWNLCAELRTQPHHLALQIANRLADGFPLVIGAELESQVHENSEVLIQMPANIDEIVARTASLADRTTEKLRNPSLWPRVPTPAQ